RLRRLAGEASAVLALERLDSGAVGELVGGERAEQVFAESEGLPLFVAEYLATVADGGAPGREMRDLVTARIAGLDATSRQLLETASVIGRSFGFETVRAASGRGDDETTDALDALVARAFVRETADGGYDFTHGRLREIVYEETGRARRR